MYLVHLLPKKIRLIKNEKNKHKTPNGQLLYLFILFISIHFCKWAQGMLKHRYNNG